MRTRTAYRRRGSLTETGHRMRHVTVAGPGTRSRCSDAPLPRRRVGPVGRNAARRPVPRKGHFARETDVVGCKATCTGRCRWRILRRDPARLAGGPDRPRSVISRLGGGRGDDDDPKVPPLRRLVMTSRHPRRIPRRSAATAVRPASWPGRRDPASGGPYPHEPPIRCRRTDTSSRSRHRPRPERSGGRECREPWASCHDDPSSPDRRGTRPVQRGRRCRRAPRRRLRGQEQDLRAIGRDSGPT
jgi:hypothetical protein